MKGQPKKNLVRPLLPLGFSSLLLVVLLCGLSQVIGAEPEVSSAVAPREENRLGLLDYRAGVSVCQQTENRVPNPGFEQDIEEPYDQPDHWFEDGACIFSYDDPGPDSDVSARIFAGSSRDENCRLRTTRGESPVEPSRFYSCSASVRTNLLRGDAYLRITFWRWQEDDWEKVGDAYYTGPVTDTQELWVEVTGSAQAPADAEYAMVEAILPESSLGSVWFDNVFLGLATCLDISKSDDPDPVEPGQMLTYTIVYSNTGREKATDVEIIETYDEYVDFKRAQPPPLAGTINIWRIPELLSDTSGTITVVVQVEHDIDIEECAWLSNTAQILSDETVEAISTTITTTVTAIPPTEVDINDPTTGHINTAYTFTATVSPVTATLPITYVWEASGQPPVVNMSGLVDTVTFTWSTTGAHTIAVMAMNDWGIVTDTRIITVELRKIYLPLVHNPPVPTLNPISNPEGSGSYTVSWSAVSLASDYVLEEATDSVFTGATEVYTRLVKIGQTAAHA